MTKTQPDLSAVVLCYKSGELAEDFYRRLKKSILEVTDNFEIILVGNFSDPDDITPQVVTKIAHQDPRVKAVTLKKQGGRGWDVQTGFAIATGKYICLIEGDDQLKPELTKQVYQKITQEKLDFVKTVRVSRGDGWYRQLVSNIFNTLFKILFHNTNFSDINSTPKIMTKQALDQMTLTDKEWSLDAQMMIQVIQLHLKVGEVAAEFHKNEYRSSFVGLKAIIETTLKLFLYKFQ